MAVMVAAGAGAAVPFVATAEEIPQGIYVGDYNLGGLTKEEAEKLVSENVEKQKDQVIVLDINGTQAETTAEELGFHWSNESAVEEASDAYYNGNLIRRYMMKKDLEKEPVHVELQTSVDDDKVTAFVADKCADMVAEPQDAQITRADGAFVITPETDGMTVDIPATVKAVNEALSSGKLEQNVTVNAVITKAEPKITEEMLATIQDVLGTFSTDFSSSGAARSTNLKVGAGKINGHVLLPGETLSGYECMEPFTTENGYETSKAYENGMVVDSIGGGVCQIATTLYNASLLSEVEITQRQNHSMAVGYVKPSMDAAIAGTSKDIKITNNYSTPIYVEGYTSGKTLTFTIYGKETRPANRRVDYVSETLSVTDPGAPTVQNDSTMRAGARVNVQAAHQGIKSRLWKVVYVDDVETERTLLNDDVYNPSKAIVKVGTAGGSSAAATQPAETHQAPAASAEPAPETQAPAPETQEQAPVYGENGGPGVSGPLGN